ncbi:ImmA/IrrE family metallo-endopeptidase [Brevibacillus sp. H7]|uniref:ImmA/IrrE family metallo-endopeptidase n=1 Tax=Brevibacillus sp. H7 TaxID=3349138 RepID=UPI0037FC8357
MEKWLTRFYIGLGFSHPHELNEDIIADSLGIELFYLPSPSMRYEAGLYRSITLNSTLSKKKQREHFYHELGHILRGHAGKQTMMEKPFRELQEAQASHFLMYAAIPFYMVSTLKMPCQEGDFICLLADEFKVTHELAARRLDQIKRRIYQGKMDELRYASRTNARRAHG